MTDPRFAVALPSRGIVHSRTFEAVLRAVRYAARSGLEPCDPWWSFAHSLPIPDSHETAIGGAFDLGADLIWVVEEDNVPAEDALIRSWEVMVEEGAGQVAVDYPIGNPFTGPDQTKWGTVYRHEGEVVFTGFGITLIARRVLEAMPRPWFRVDQQLEIARSGSELWFNAVDIPPAAGGVDILWCWDIRRAGFSLAEVPDMVGGHGRLRSWGEYDANRGQHEIDVWDSIDNYQGEPPKVRQSA